MKKVKVVAIRDIKAEMWLKPTFETNEETAKRNFMIMVQDSETRLSQTPEDYSLYVIAEYNNDNATYEDFKENKLLCNGLDFVQPYTLQSKKN